VASTKRSVTPRSVKGSHRLAAVTPATTSTAIPCARGCDFLGRAAKDRQIAGFQAHHLLARHGRYNRRVGAGLRPAMRAHLFANEHTLCTNAGKGQNLGVHQPVIEHNIRLTQHADRTQGQQVGHSRTGTDEKYLAGSLRRIGCHNQ
jgi:hypothetical protein